MKNIKLFILTLLLLLSTSSCRKFVELDAPKTLLVSTNAFADDATAISTVIGIYAKMVDNDNLPFAISVFTGLQSDELKTANGSWMLLYQNNLIAANTFTSLFWFNGYNFIYQANAAFEGCDKSTAIDPIIKKQLMAEARFIRAYWYFYLVNLFGDVPLITTTDYTQNAVAARTSKELVYKQIISDLEYAKNNLNENYISPNSVSATSNRVRPNKASASALLARVFLYTGNYAEAEAQATLVINQNDTYKIEEITSTFLSSSKETIWALMKPTPTQIASLEAYYYIIDTKPVSGSERQSSTISDQLLSAFEKDDLRKKNWIGMVSNGGVNYYFPKKYKDVFSLPPIEDSIVLRLAEQYLIRAEARANMGYLSGAIEDIDVIRKRAGIKLVRDEYSGISKDDLIKAIIKERQTELFTEYGHRWLDLKRSGEVDAVMNLTTPIKGGIWSSNKQLWPIPQKELSSDVNLVQNPGYN